MVCVHTARRWYLDVLLPSSRDHTSWRLPDFLGFLIPLPFVSLSKVPYFDVLKFFWVGVMAVNFLTSQKLGGRGVGQILTKGREAAWIHPNSIWALVVLWHQRKIFLFFSSRDINNSSQQDTYISNSNHSYNFIHYNPSPDNNDHYIFRFR